MARRKQTTIKLENLKIHSALINELKNDMQYSDKDLSTLKLTVFDSYEATIVDVDKAISNLKRYIVVNKKQISTFQGEQLINRVQLAKMLGISRQTLTSWIDKGFITPHQFKYIPDKETFNTDIVLKELLKHKSEYTDK